MFALLLMSSPQNLLNLVTLLYTPYFSSSPPHPFDAMVFACPLPYIPLAPAPSPHLANNEWSARVLLTLEMWYPNPRSGQKWGHQAFTRFFFHYTCKHLTLQPPRGTNVWFLLIATLLNQTKVVRKGEMINKRKRSWLLNNSPHQYPGSVWRICMLIWGFKWPSM